MGEQVNPAAAIAWQAEHCRRNDAPLTARVLDALEAALADDTAVARAVREWPGLTLADAMPLRLAGGLHWLYLSGTEPRLAPVYQNIATAGREVSAIIRAAIIAHDVALIPWLAGPPQTNEAARSAAIVAGLLWLAGQTTRVFELNEIGASAGANTMIERYRYELGGVAVGPLASPVAITPQWGGPPPPTVPFTIAAIKGCDQAPIDLANPAAALRLKAYVWAEGVERMARLDAVVALARDKLPIIARADAADWVEEQLAAPQPSGTTRALYHSIVWQYIPEAGRARITAAMAAAGAGATAERPLAWIMLETNRETFAHELRVKYWPGGDDEWVLLGQAHAHGAWVKWFGG